MSNDNPPVDHVVIDDESGDEPRAAPIEDNVKSKAAWMRLLFMFVFYILASLAAMVASVVVIFGFAWVLFTGEPNEQLQKTGKGIAAYIYQIVAYLTYNTEARPFPFDNAWPSGGDVTADVSADVMADDSQAS